MENEVKKSLNFIEEIVSSLTKEGFDEKILREIVVDEFHKTVNMLSLMANKPAFYKLATALARGYTQDAANKYSATELIDGAALDEVVDEFLDLYKLFDLPKNVNQNSIKLTPAYNMWSVKQYNNKKMTYKYIIIGIITMFICHLLL